MAFRFADLMISVLPSIDENVIAPRCNIVTCVFGTCSINPNSCWWSIQIPPLPFSDPFNELAILKAQLQQTLAQIEAQEEAMKERMRPQTLAEATALEEKMVQALEELRRQKEELQKKAAGGQGQT